MVTDMEPLAQAPAGPRELDARTLDDGMELRLLWVPGPDGGQVILEATPPDGGHTRVRIPSAAALDAFRHPWLHLPPVRRSLPQPAED